MQSLNLSDSLFPSSTALACKHKTRCFVLISAVGGSFRNNIDCFVLISIANDNYRNKNAGNVLFHPYTGLCRSGKENCSKRGAQFFKAFCRILKKNWLYLRQPFVNSDNP